jgi:hypothetical protein
MHEANGGQYNDGSLHITPVLLYMTKKNVHLLSKTMHWRSALTIARKISQGGCSMLKIS